MFKLKDSSREANVEPGGEVNRMAISLSMLLFRTPTAKQFVPYHFTWIIKEGVVLSQTVTDYPVPFPPGNCCINADLCQRTYNYPLPWL